MSDFRRVKTINSHSGLARFLAECDREGEDLVIVGYLAQVQRDSVPSYGSYSPATMLYRWEGKRVFVSEVRHRRFEVYEVSAQMLTFKDDDAATDWHIRFRRQ
jgi:hypothetical protein